MTTLTQTIPFHYDVVGSLLRPASLKQAHAQLAAGEITPAAELKSQQTEIKRIVAEQVKLGLQAVTDGEFSRSWWHLDFLWGLNGVDKYDYHQSYKFKGDHTRTDNAELTGKVAFNPNHPFFAAFSYLQSIVPAGILAKQTIPSPTMLFRDNRSDNWAQFYDSWEAYLTDLAQAYHATLQHFYDLGCRYIQLDDTTWAFLISKLNDDTLTASEQAHFHQMATDAVQVINASLADLPADLKVTTHICRGNFKSTYLFSGSYQVVAKYLGQLHYDGLFLEYDNARAGNFDVLDQIWNGDPHKQLVLGLVTSKFPALEQPADLIARIKSAATKVPLANLALSTQCGFASTEEGNELTEAEQWAKLALVIKTAQTVWSKA